MNIYDATFAVIDALEAAKIPYMLVGSLSSMFFGGSRSTVDADFVIELGATPLAELTTRLGRAFRLDPQMSFETITATTRNILEVVDTPFKVELFRLSQDPHDVERFHRRRQVRLLERDVWLPTAEDVVVTKLRWLRKKDQLDIQTVIAVQGNSLDWEYIYRWCDTHGTRHALEELRREIPPDLMEPPA